ncbi:MAG: Bcr/CflA family efflux MFS transporter, partial [Pseudomonadota bacterium]
MESTPAKSPALLTLILLSGLSIVSLTMFLPSLANIARTFETDYALINLSIAGYAGMTAIVQLIVGPLSDRYGRRPVMLWALLVFSVASVGCLFAQNVWAFLGFRLLQAAVISGYAISVAVVRDTYSAEKSASLIGYITAVSAIAPMLGPMIGGALDDLFGWRSNFVVFTSAGIFMFFICWIDLRETNMSASTTFRLQMRSYQELVQSKRFWGYSLCMAFCNAAFYVFLGGAPLLAKSVFNVSTSEVGFYMGTTTVGFVLGSFLAGRFAADYRLTTT